VARCELRVEAETGSQLHGFAVFADRRAKVLCLLVGECKAQTRPEIAGLEINSFEQFRDTPLEVAGPGGSEAAIVMSLL
jgi:hypothetical protein